MRSGGLPRREPPNDLKGWADEGFSRNEIRAVHLILKSTHSSCKKLMYRFAGVALVRWYGGEKFGGGAVADGCRHRDVAVLFEQWSHVEQRITDGARTDLEQFGQDSASAQLPQVQHRGQDTFGIGDLLKEDSAAAAGLPLAATLGVAASFDHGGLPNDETFDEFVQLPATHAGQRRMRQRFGEQPIRGGTEYPVLADKSDKVGGGVRGRTKMSAGKPLNVSTMSRINWLFLLVVIGNQVALRRTGRS